jgi:hypothetical protein
MLWRKITRRLLDVGTYEAWFSGGWPQIKKVARHNMPNQPVSDPQFWRNLAAKARAKADQTIDDRTKRLLLRIAESHESVAKLVEQRARDAEKSK